MQTEMNKLQRSLNSAWLKFCFDTLFRLTRDPWNYSSPYQQWKYEQELQLLPPTPISLALELGCAEGIFTIQLASRVEHLVAADISATALMRANQRCVLQQCENVRLIQFDLTQDELPAERFDLIICSEVLYYIGNQAILREITEKLAKSLKPNGYLLTSNDYRIKAGKQDIPPVQNKILKTSRIFGAEAIAATLSETSLQLVKVIQTPFHCTHLFQRSFSEHEPVSSPEIISLPAAKVPHPQGTVFDWFSISAIVKYFNFIRSKMER